MPQNIDIHGVFIDPETITGLQLQKRTSVYYPVFHEVGSFKGFLGRLSSGQRHVLQFDHQEAYGIVLPNTEYPDPGSLAVTYRDAATERFLRGIQQTGKNIVGHFQEMFKIDISGDRQLRIIQSGRNVKQISLREIPAKVKLLSGQWVDVFKSSPDYEFHGGTPYAVTDVPSSALMICTKDKTYLLYGAGVDASDQELAASYQNLTDLYNRIQAGKTTALEEHKNRPPLQLPQISIQLPKIEMPQIRFQSPIAFGKKKAEPENSALPKAETNANDPSDPK